MPRFGHSIPNALDEVLAGLDDNPKPMNQKEKQEIIILTVKISVVSLILNVPLFISMWNWFIVKQLGVAPLDVLMGSAFVLIRAYFFSPPMPNIDTAKLNFEETKKAVHISAINQALKYLSYWIAAIILHQII